MNFLIKFTGSCFSIATIWEYENMRQKALHFKRRASDWVYRQVQNPKHVLQITHSINYENVI